MTTEITAKGCNFMKYLREGKSIQAAVENFDYINCPIMGVTFDPDRAQGQMNLKPGQELFLELEPKNKHDPFAIKVLDVEKKMLGYIPKELACNIPDVNFYKVLVLEPYQPIQGSIMNWGAQIRLIKKSFLSAHGLK